MKGGWNIKSFEEFRWLMLVLVLAERAWSYGMQLKDDVETNRRARFRMHRKFAKAAKFSQQLVELCNVAGDNKTVLEAEVITLICVRIVGLQLLSDWYLSERDRKVP